MINQHVHGLCLIYFLLSSGLATALPLEELSLPPGFQIQIYAEHVPDARSLALGPEGVVFVGTRRAGNVYALIDHDGDHRVDKVRILTRDRIMPNGIVYHDGDLYVAETHRILKFEKVLQQMNAHPDNLLKGKEIYSNLPRKSGHDWRYMGMGPDGWLYIAIGVPCNICEHPGTGLIRRVKPDGSQSDIYAVGVRNSVGLDWHPETGDLWFSDNGRDWLGDDQPPDELNHAPRAKLHFGFPHCHGGDLPDPDYGQGVDCQKYTPPARKLGAHVAPLGIRFYTGKAFPTTYHKQLFVAEHGSWNRSTKVGYRIMWGRIENNKVVDYQPFITGWLDESNDQAWGRPVDLLVLPDGSLLISDDAADTVYRVTYSGPASQTPQ